MNKIAIITDQHFGSRNDSPNFLDYYEKFYEETFFPKLLAEGIKTLLVLGDTFDRRKYINFFTLKRAKEMFFSKLHRHGIQVHMLVGNHDTYFKNTNEVNSVALLSTEFDNINVIDHPSTIPIGNKLICMMPWICAENYDDSMNELQSTRARICMGHFEISGFAMHRGMPSEEGLHRDIFKRFGIVMSGHYHHRSNSGNIHYLGNPYELTWSDYDDPRGFHLFDLDTNDLEFIVNPNRMFHRVVYDDTVESVDEINTKDLSVYKEVFVKLVVVNKSNPVLFDKFIERLYAVSPLDVTIIEDAIDLTEGVEDDRIDEAEDTLTTINKFVDAVTETNIDIKKLKNVMRELYVEALNLEQA